MTTQKIEFANGLRGIAALSVIAGHYVGWIGLSVSLVVLVIGGSILGTRFPHSAVEVLYGYLIGTRDIVFVKSVDGVVWTIEIELKFYLICALIAPWLREGSLKVIWIIPCVLLLVACILGIVLIPSATATTLYFALLSAPYLLFMFVGVAFNFLVSDSFLLSFAAAVAVFAIAMRFPNVVGSIPWIGFWADISYPLYVVHGLTGYVLIEVLIASGMGAWPAILIAFATVTILAAALHATIETPSREMGRRVAAATRGGYAMSEAEAPMRPD